MKSSVPSSQPQFVSYLWACFGTLLLVGAAFMFYVWTEKRIDHANQLRYASHNLVEELRQSSDDLTRMARTYVATGDAQYRKHHDEIVAIRDGQAPRPQNYENVYWDMVTASGPRPRSGEHVCHPTQAFGLAIHADVSSPRARSLRAPVPPCLPHPASYPSS